MFRQVKNKANNKPLTESLSQSETKANTNWMGVQRNVKSILVGHGSGREERNGREREKKTFKHKSLIEPSLRVALTFKNEQIMFR